MIHYHGTPITPRPALEGMAGRNFCVSFAAPQDLRTVVRIGQSVMLDNGAFSAFTRGVPLDVDGYYRWIDPVLAHPHWAVIPDVIGGDVDAQRAMVAGWPFGPALGAPVWHLGLPISYLIELCEAWPRVCLGSSAEYWQVGGEAWCRRMDEAFNALASTFGARIPWIHGLRMLGQSDGRWPLASADSANVGRNYKDRGVCPDCMAQRIDSVNPAPRWRITHIQGGLI